MVEVNLAEAGEGEKEKRRIGLREDHVDLWSG
jgi:hypothetical protein